VAAVGTEIYWQAGEPWQPWEQHISRGWDRSTVVALAEPLADLHPQPLPEPEPYKVSYYLAADAAVATLPSLRQLLRQANISAEVIYSGHRDLDIIPKGSNKGAAVQFLQNHWQTSVAVACGDSGNDISLFSQGLPHGIVVGNAHSELRLWYELNATDRHYLAQDHYARGIMEGLIYFGFWG
jgi:sucrose-6-phosphatase